MRYKPCIYQVLANPKSFIRFTCTFLEDYEMVYISKEGSENLPAKPSTQLTQQLT